MAMMGRLGTGCGEHHISGSLVVYLNFQDPEVGGVGDGCGGNYTTDMPCLEIYAPSRDREA